MRLGWVGDDEHAVVVVGRANEHADGFAAQLAGCEACVFEGFPRNFEHDALLRVHVLGLEWGDAEEFVVEGGDAVHVAAVGVFFRHFSADDGVAEVFIPAWCGKWAGGGAAFDEHLPEFGVVFGAWEAAGGADDGNVVGARGRSCLTTTPYRPLPLHRRQRRGDRSDGRILVGDGRVYAAAEERFQFAGEDHGVAGCEAVGLQRRGRVDVIYAGGALNPAGEPLNQIMLVHNSSDYRPPAGFCYCVAACSRSVNRFALTRRAILPAEERAISPGP